MGCFDFNHAPQRLRLRLNNIESARWQGIIASDTHKIVFENVEAIGDNVDIIYLCRIHSLEHNALL